MTDEVTIRSVAPTDFHQWLALWEGYNVFYERIGPAAIPAEVTRMTWARFFDSYEPMEAVVAERGGQLHRPRSLHLSSQYDDAWAHLLSAGPVHRRGGTWAWASAAALINGVYDRARAAGSTRVYWQTHKTNVTAQKLYDKVAESSGFIVYRKDI